MSKILLITGGTGSGKLLNKAIANKEFSEIKIF
ncbi:MAG: hypothetical protein CM15mP109_07260 [Candidatus Dadabacteria bacterium]|nr:MAG: hypothetical protein CM15mP109_07260 [Candidatus Dadabacteria bacterium]